MNGIRAFMDSLKRDKARRRRLAGLFCVLALFVAGGVSWRLRIIGLTKTAEPLCNIPEHIHTEECIIERRLICDYPDEPEAPKVLNCGFAVHAHDESCYDIGGNLICGRADYVIHRHDEKCFDENGFLVCALPEIFEHVHSEICYAPSEVYSCGLNEGDLTIVHAHDDICYEIQKTLTCELSEGEEHTHSDECYAETANLICSLPETEAHIHGEDCVPTMENILTCDTEERIVHTHIPECYAPETEVLICGKLELFEHQHGEYCFAAPVIGGEASLGEPIEDFNPDFTHDFGFDPVINPALGELTPVTDTLEAESFGEPLGFNAVGEDIGEVLDDMINLPEPAVTAAPDVPAEPEIIVDSEITPQPEVTEPEVSEPAITEPVVTLPEEIIEPVATGHVHTDECYEIIYGCGLEEHTHSIICYSDISADLDVEEYYQKVEEALYSEGLENQGDLIAAIAKSQLGYKESKQNFIIDENGERKGYNLYSAWYTNGEGAYIDWNATFAAFCLENAFIERDFIRFNSGVHAWTVALSEANLLERDIENAKLGAGDLVFLDTDGDGIADRVGISTGKIGDDGTFVTIEGDTPEPMQTAFEEGFNLTALGFVGGFGTEAESIFGETESEDMAESCAFDVDAIETHAVAEVGHSRAEIFGYVKFSGEEEVEPYALITGGYMVYEGDYQGLKESDKYVIVNAKSNGALTFDDSPVLGGVTGATTNDVPVSLTEWTLEKVDGKWTGGTLYHIYTTVNGQRKYLGYDPRADATQKIRFDDGTAGGFETPETFYPNFRCVEASGSTLKLRPTNVGGATPADGWLSLDSNNNFVFSPNESVITLEDTSGNSFSNLNKESLPHYSVRISINNRYLTTKTHDGYIESVGKNDTVKRLNDVEKYTKWTISMDTQNWGTAEAQKIHYVYYLKSGDKYISLPLDSSHNPSAQEIGTSAYGLSISSAANGYNIKSYAWACNNLYWNGSAFVPNDYSGADYSTPAYTVNFYDAKTGDLVNLDLNDKTVGSRGEYILVINNDVVVSAVSPTNCRVIDVPFDGNNVADKQEWTFSQNRFTDKKYDKYDYRFKNSTGRYVRDNDPNHRVDGNNAYTTSGSGWQEGESKVSFVPYENKTDGKKGFLIMSMNGNGDDTKYYLIRKSDNSGYQWCEFNDLSNTNPHSLNDTDKEKIASAGGLFNLYQQPTDYPVDHVYEIVTNGAPAKNQNTPIKLVLREGEVVRLSLTSDGYHSGAIKFCDNYASDAESSSFVDCKHYRLNGSNSEYLLEAVAEGKTLLKLVSDKNDATIHIEVTVVPNDDGDAKYREAIKETFGGYYYGNDNNTSKRYRHLDVEVDADFDIKVYRPDGTMSEIKPDPGSIKVTKVEATVYNTASLLADNKGKATWQRATYNGAVGFDPGNGAWVNSQYANPIPASQRDSIKSTTINGRTIYQLCEGVNEEGKDILTTIAWAYKNETPPYINEMYLTNGKFDLNKICRDYTFDLTQTNDYPREYFPDSEFGSDNVVNSYTVQYNTATIQANGQNEFLTNGWGWLELYDGDTVDLTCTVEYKYNGVTYTVDKVVRRVICDTNNICPQSYGNGGTIQGFDIDVFFDDVNEFESTEFIKVDQYGDSVAGIAETDSIAMFDFYKAHSDGSGNYVRGERIAEEKTNENGVFHFTYGDIVEKYGADAQETKDLLGEIRPGGAKVGDYKPDLPLTMAQLNKFLGDCFVIVETKVPEGYRRIGSQINMRFLGTTDGSVDMTKANKNLFLVCDNSFECGVYTDPNALIMAPENEILINAKDSNQIEYVKKVPDGKGGLVDEPQGTLYAVVAKRNGVARNENGNNTALSYTTEAMKYDDWTIVYGNDFKGYEYAGAGAAGVAKLIKMRGANKLPVGEGLYEFSQDKFTPERYSVTAKNLPGDIQQYVNFMIANGRTNDDDFGNYEYAILYYYLPNGADMNNDKDVANKLVRVTNFVNSGTTGNRTNFDVTWSSTIEIPNIENRLFFQKRDSDGNLLNDAGFALYHSNEPTDTELNAVKAAMTNSSGGTSDLDYSTVYTDAYFTERQEENGTVLTHYYLGDVVAFNTNTDVAKGKIPLYGKDWHAVGPAIVYENGKATKAIFSLDYLFSNGTIGKDNNGYIIKPSIGQISFFTYDEAHDKVGGNIGSTINPVKRPDDSRVYVGYTHSGGTRLGAVDECEYVPESGTGHFGKIPNGRYILREITPPNGFNILPSPNALILVNDSGVYANAGEVDDGISVMNGAGYLVSTLESFATRGTVDESLRWIYTAMRATDGTKFSDFTKDVNVSGVTQGTTAEEKAPYAWSFVKPSDETYTSPSGTKIKRVGWAGVEKGDEQDKLIRTSSLSNALVNYLEYQTEYIGDDDDLNPNKGGKIKAPKALFDYETNNHLREEEFDEFYNKTISAQEAKRRGKYPALVFDCEVTVPVEIGTNHVHTFPAGTYHGQEERNFCQETGHDHPVNKGSGTLRLMSSTGWSSLSIYQDFQWASAFYAAHPEAKHSAYNEMPTRELTQLYSNSTFVQFVDNVGLKLTLIKRGDKNGNGEIDTDDQYLDGTEFVLYQVEKNAENKDIRKYYCYNKETQTIEWKVYAEDEKGDGANGTNVLYPDAYRFVTNGDGVVQIDISKEGTYFLEEIKVKEPYGVIEPLEIKITRKNGVELTDPTGSGNNEFYKFTKLDSSSEHYNPNIMAEQYALEILDPKNYRIEVEKVDSRDRKTPLAGAQFVAYKLEGGEKLYYDYFTVKGVVTTTEIKDAQVFETVIDKDNPTRAYFAIDGISWNHGEFFIEEIKAPPGYHLLPAAIKVEGGGGKPKVTLEGKQNLLGEVTEIRDTDGTVIGYRFAVENESGYELPETGSSGELLYTLFGISLMILPIMLGCVRRRRERRAGR